MRGLLRELTTVGGLDAIGAAKHATGFTGRAAGGAQELISSVADAASRVTNTASELASQVASDVGSELASNMASNARASTTLDSATALPTRQSGSDAMDAAAHGKEHLQPPHSVWHGHGRIPLLLVAVHLLAFVYWIYLCVAGRKFEAKRTDQPRRVVKPFKVVYEWSLNAALELSSAMRKKQASKSPAASPRAAIALSPQRAPLHPTTWQPPPAIKTAPSLARSNSGFSLNKLIKAPAP